MKRFTRYDKERGELAARRLSDKARRMYSTTDIHRIYEDVDGVIYFEYLGGKAEQMSIDEIQALLEADADEADEADEADDV